jgi:UTP--glucose-1-phosphate uridylyltransferase
MIGNEPFFFFFADDFFTGEESTATQMLHAYQKTGSSVVALREVPEHEISTYGIAAIEGEIVDGMVKVTGIAEKPSVQDAPSNLAVGSGYLLTPDILPILEKEEVGPDGEVRVSDAFEKLAQQSNVYGLQIKGEYHDTGNPEAYLKTLIDVTLQDPAHGQMLREFLKHKLDE